MKRLEDAVQSPPDKSGKPRYLYFQVTDHWAFELSDQPQRDFILEVRTSAPAEMVVEYDSHDRDSTLHGAYTVAPRIDPPPGDAPAERQLFRLSQAFLGNRQNGASDFRLILRERSPVNVEALTLRAARSE